MKELPIYSDVRSNPYETAYHMLICEDQSLWKRLPCADKRGAIVMKQLPVYSDM